MNSHFALVCPGCPTRDSCFCLPLLSQSISFFYSMPTKSFTMPYHLNKGKQKHRKLNQLFPGQRRPRKSRFTLITNGKKSFWLSRKPCLKKYCPTTKILAIHLEEELLLKQKQAKANVPGQPYIAGKSSDFGFL